MTLFVDGHNYGYELQRVTQMFCFGEKVAVAQGTPPADFSGECVHALLRDGAAEVFYRADTAEKHLRCVPGDFVEENAELTFGVLIYRLLSEATGLCPPWGVLTGIRPVKLFIRRIREGMDQNALRDAFITKRKVDESRFALALKTARAELPLLDRSTSDSFSLYVSIPFCPSRCAYCSFVSHSVEQAAKLIPAYVDRLCEELALTAKIAEKLGLRLRTVYFGGGTPTALTAGQLERLMETVAANFDLENVWEYTVEAGRPDTITQEKLRVIRRLGAGRVSINPQTLSDEVLRAVGRRHTAAQCMERYREARDMGFSVNMDLIAGLPADTEAGFRASVDGLAAAGPDNVTVHTLTLKRAARLSSGEARAKLDTVRAMTDYARERLERAGYAPYYLYRQNGTLSALENVGYAKPGTYCLYNVYMMDETHSVLAVGAGASTRLCHPVTGEIGRVYNYKYPYEYLERFDEIKKRKEQIVTFFGTPL